MVGDLAASFADEYRPPAILYRMLHLRACSNPSFLQRTLRYAAGRRRRTRSVHGLDLLPMRLCTAANDASVSAGGPVAKRLAVLVHVVQNRAPPQRLQAFLYQGKRTMDAVDVRLPPGFDPTESLFLQFSTNFLERQRDPTRWSVRFHVVSDRDDTARVVLDLSTISSNFTKCLPPSAIDLPLYSSSMERVGCMNVQFAWWYTHETPTTGDRTRPRAKDPPVANAKTTIMYLFGSARRCELVRSARCPFCPADCADARQLLVHLCCMHGHLYYARRGTTLVVSRTPLSDDWPPGIPSSLSPILRDDTPAFSFRNGREIADRLSSYLCKTHTLSSGSRLAELLGIGAPTMKPSRPRDDSRPTYRKWPKRKAPVPLSVPLGKRVFYHGTTFTPCRLPDASVPDDSDLDVDDAWVRSQSDQTLALFEDVADDEKRFMSIWNLFVRRHPPGSDRDLDDACLRFVRERRSELVQGDLRQALLSHLIVLWEFGVLSEHAIDGIVAAFDDDGPDPGTPVPGVTAPPPEDTTRRIDSRPAI
ncbi:Polycomb protein VEFS-Box domain-containing protein [Plasmodiophora brassicae]|uniref:Polycomb protein VEFS-Box domain-containing protein n=1 Tax=Plasmodiophora brassicae TaxID=37360 RepID=A0A0G4ISL4_PLABS|nr:hypothetical protein PBRA_006326 [Plasmodiophora brassicae]SPQ95218.1 unnamed protein product [Plasmodiophora brassicae]